MKAIILTLTLLLAACDHGFGSRSNDLSHDYVSNGERIYLTGTSASGQPVNSLGGDAAMGMHRQMHSGGCASCHGDDREGRRLWPRFWVEAPALTAEALASRQFLGVAVSSETAGEAADYITQKLPGSELALGGRANLYYWYYATQVLKHIDGPQWERWNRRLRPLLTRSQEKSGELAGSWDPYKPVPDRWGAFGGRLYVTTMNLLSLAVTYRYLPLYEDTAR